MKSLPPGEGEGEDGGDNRATSPPPESSPLKGEEMDRTYAMDWQPPGDQIGLGQELVKAYRIAPPSQLTSCSTCHH